MRASKARAVWWLGLVGLLTGPLVGGVVPATMALLLATQFRAEARPADGFLTGAAVVRRGERLAMVGLLLATAALVTAGLVGLFRYAGGAAGPDFGPGVN